ncbi:hypothetical protein SDJN02_01058, partial [Cucurbita argyrosperma subsp. argyrosperma]
MNWVVKLAWPRAFLGTKIQFFRESKSRRRNPSCFVKWITELGWKMIGMGEEEQKRRCFNHRFGSFGTIGGISGRSSSKKLKPKPRKVPQRGLGVAQLERIRLEEQQKNGAGAGAGAAIFSSPSPLSPTKSSSYMSLPIPGFRQSNRSSSSSSFSRFLQ